MCFVPALNYFFANGDSKLIYSAITDGVIIVFAIVVLMSISMEPTLTSKQYASVSNSSNILVYYFAYKSFKKHDKKIFIRNPYRYCN